MPRFKVKCDCPTPLAKNPAEVDAENEIDAKKRFFGINGISDTNWPLSIDEIKTATKKPAVKKAEATEKK